MTYLLHYNLSQNGQIPSILEIFCKKTLSEKLSKYHQFYIGSLNYLNITPYSLNLLKPSLPTFSQLTLSSLTFSISLSLSQSCYQLTLTFSISLSNSPTCSQSPFQSRSRSHSPSPLGLGLALLLGLPLALLLTLSVSLSLCIFSLSIGYLWVFASPIVCIISLLFVVCFCF